MKHPISILIFLISTSLFFACSKVDEPSPRVKLTTINISLLYYEEMDTELNPYPSYSNIVYDKDFKNSIDILYDNNNQIIGTNYGATRYHAGTNMSFLVISKSNVNKIQFKGDTVYTESCYPYTTYPDTTKYLIKDGKLIERRECRRFDSQSPIYERIFKYTYSSNKIIETNNDLQTTIIHLNNSNVERIERFQYDISKEIYSKTEYIYSDYDQSINLLKGLYYIHGAFNNAFSANNYRKSSLNIYSVSNNQLTLKSSTNETTNFRVDANNIPDLFGYEYY
ncbi:MAG: hypothetical protein ACOYOT_06600 [Bacteroidales bacterium]